MPIEVVSIQTVMPVFIKYKIGDDIKTIFLYLDSAKKKVYFTDEVENSDEIQEAVINYLANSQPQVAIPIIPSEVKNQIERYRKGDYNSFINEFEGFGGRNA